VETALRNAYGQITDVVIHLEPAADAPTGARQPAPGPVD
jgi:hypothetical protein